MVSLRGWLLVVRKPLYFFPLSTKKSSLPLQSLTGLFSFSKALWASTTFNMESFSKQRPKIPLVQFSTKASTQTQCSSGVLLKHFTCFQYFANTLPPYFACCQSNLVLNSASTLLEVLFHLVQFLLAASEDRPMAPCAEEEREDGLAGDLARQLPHQPRHL